MSDIYFVPFDSVVDTTFWHVLSKKKLEDYRLDEGPFPMFGQFTNGTPPGVSPRMSFDYASMNEWVLPIVSWFSFKNRYIIHFSFLELKQPLVEICSMLLATYMSLIQSNHSDNLTKRYTLITLVANTFVRLSMSNMIFFFTLINCSSFPF